MENEETHLLNGNTSEMQHHNSVPHNLLRKFYMRLRYYVPIFGWLPLYDLNTFQNDIIAGLTVASLVIPQSLAYAQALVEIPPVLGLVSAFIPQFLYALLGTSKQLAVGPEALVSILVGSSIREFTKWRDASPFQIVADTLDPYRNIQACALLCLMVGLFTFMLGIFRLGFLDSVLSRALLRGFILAVACVVVIDMSETMLGLKLPPNRCHENIQFVAKFEDEDEPGSPFLLLLKILSEVSNAHKLTASVSAISITFLMGFRELKRRKRNNRAIQLVPEILVLVIVSMVLTQIFRWDCKGLAILNDVQSTLPDNVKVYPLPTLPKIKHLMLSAILITIIGFVESIAVAKTYASKHNYGVSPNRELVAMGTGNIVSSVFGAYPSFGSLGRSAVNDAAGATTQMAGLITGTIVFMTYLWFLPLFKYLPQAVCSSIIVVAALKLIEFEEIYFLVKLRAWSDIALLLLTLSSTIFISIETGTLLSVGTSLLLVVKHTTTTKLIILGQYLYLDPETGIFKEKYRQIRRGDENVHAIEGIMIVRLEEGCFFGNVGQLKSRLKRIELHGDVGIHPGEDPMRESLTRDENQWDDSTHIEQSNHRLINGVIFDMKSVPAMDASAAHTMYEIVDNYKKRGIKVCFVKLRNDLKELFSRAGLIELIGEANFFQKIKDAVPHVSQSRDHQSEIEISHHHSELTSPFVSFDNLEVLNGE